VTDVGVCRQLRSVGWSRAGTIAQERSRRNDRAGTIAHNMRLK
jgi:hypothetical protein